MRIVTDTLLLFWVAFLGVASAADVKDPSFNQPDQVVDVYKDLNDGIYESKFKDQHTSVVELRIGDSPIGHVMGERELNLTSGNNNHCDPMQPAVDSNTSYTIPNGEPIRWELRYIDEQHMLQFDIQGGPTLNVVLTQPISEIMIRGQAVKSGTSASVNVLEFNDKWFKKVDNWETNANATVPLVDKDIVFAAGGPDWIRLSLEHLTKGFELRGVTTLSWNAGDPPLRSQLAMQIKLNCNTPAITPPEPWMAGHGPWSGKFQVVAGGLEAHEVRSLRRKFAEAIYVPYGSFRNNKNSGGVTFQLNVPDDYFFRNDLIKLETQAVGTAETGSQGSYVRATFQLESMYECVRITQWYEMHDTLNPWSPFDRAEMPYPMPPNSGGAFIYSDFLNRVLYPAERFLPIVYFEYAPNCIDTQIEWMQLPTRVDWPLGGRGRRTKNASAFSRDPDDVADFWDLEVLNYGVTFKNTRRNPVEDAAFGFLNSSVTSTELPFWDNYHYVNTRDYVGAPGGIAGDGMIPPGAPDAMHVHWRWGEFLNWPDGLPLVPEKETGNEASVNGNDPPQDLLAHALFWRNGEERMRFRDIGQFIDADPLYTTTNNRSGRLQYWALPQSFGYQSSSAAGRNTNAFFTHGMSFNGNYSGRNEVRNYPNFNPNPRSPRRGRRSRPHDDG